MGEDGNLRVVSAKVNEVMFEGLEALRNKLGIRTRDEIIKRAISFYLDSSGIKEEESEYSEVYCEDEGRSGVTPAPMYFTMGFCEDCKDFQRVDEIRTVHGIPKKVCKQCRLGYLHVSRGD